jgi:hypothetical protein
VCNPVRPGEHRSIPATAEPDCPLLKLWLLWVAWRLGGDRDTPSGIEARMLGYNLWQLSRAKGKG